MGVPVEERINDLVHHVNVFVPVKLVFHVVQITAQGIKAAGEQITHVETGLR